MHKYNVRIVYLAFTLNLFYVEISSGLKIHILCLLTGVVHRDCTQYIALILVAYIKGWSYLNDYEVNITV